MVHDGHHSYTSTGRMAGDAGFTHWFQAGPGGLFHPKSVGRCSEIARPRDTRQKSRYLKPRSVFDASRKLRAWHPAVSHARRIRWHPAAEWRAMRRQLRGAAQLISVARRHVGRQTEIVVADIGERPLLTQSGNWPFGSYPAYWQIVPGGLNISRVMGLFCETPFTV